MTITNLRNVGRRMLLVAIISSGMLMIPGFTWRAVLPTSFTRSQRLSQNVFLTGVPSTTNRTGLQVVLKRNTTIPSTPALVKNLNISHLRSIKRTVSRSTGGFRSLPVVKGPAELINRGRRTAKVVKSDKDVKNIRARARKHGAEALNALMQSLCIPLRDTVTGYKQVYRRLHPFEQVVFDLSVRSRQRRDGLTLYEVLSQINEARKMILDSGKEWIFKVKQAATAKEAAVIMEDGQNYLIELFEQFASPPVSDLLELQRLLRSAPIVDLETPAVVLVGAPNVGKSSIVRAISSAKPEVNNYPFTTRGMTLGHVEIFWSDSTTISRAVVPEKDLKRRSNRVTVPLEIANGQYSFSQLCQVMDSPGLLVRPDCERNEMEALTLAAMQHLPTAVMYVMDLSGSAGDKCSSIEDQLALRQEIRSRFPRRPWIDVVSKVDLGIVDGALEKLEIIIGKEASYIKLSLIEGIGLRELKTEVLRMLGDVRLVLDAMAAVSDDRQP